MVVKFEKEDEERYYYVVKTRCVRCGERGEYTIQVAKPPELKGETNG